MKPASDRGGDLKVRGLRTTFATSRGVAVAVDDVNLDVAPGEVVGLVGESGSGKSVTLRSIVRLIREPGKVSGHVEWQGRDLLTMPEDELRKVRGAEIAMIFQEPMTALNPVLPVRLQIEENLQAHTTLDGRARRARALELMNIVGIPAAERRLDQYPHQFSGGMRQRVMIAIALASSPQAAARRRADDGARRHHPGPDPEAAARSARPLRHERAVRHARPRRRGGDMRPHGGDVWRPHRRDRHGRRSFRRTAPSLYARPAGLGAADRRRAHDADVDRGVAAQPDRAARRLRLPSALRLCDRSLPRGAAAARSLRSRQGSRRASITARSRR